MVWAGRLGRAAASDANRPFNWLIVSALRGEHVLRKVKMDDSVGRDDIDAVVGDAVGCWSYTKRERMNEVRFHVMRQKSGKIMRLYHT